MEFKFKKFITGRRGRSTADDNTLIVPGAPYETTSTTKEPIFIYQPLNKSATEARRDAEKIDDAPIKTFSYDQVSSGKAPIFLQALPEKGNGPIKLQATRSGEVVTTDEHDKTFNDIRDGSDYVVGRKERSSSHTLDARPISSRGTMNSVSYEQSPSSSVNLRSSSRSSHSQKSPLQSRSSSRKYSMPPIPSEFPGLGLSPSLTSIPGDRPSPSNLSGTSTTLEALRKAEYARLVELYGPQGAARSIARLERSHLQLGQSPTDRSSQTPTPVLEPLPAPHLESGSQRTSQASGISDSCGEEWSTGSSPHRASLVSSYAESSAATTQTSVAEEESTATTREDIRSMIQQMRSTYLTALHDQPDLLRKQKSRKRKQRKQKLMPSPAINETYTRQTWHPEDNDLVSHSRRKAHSHPPTSRLSPIQDSPSRKETINHGLKRADSATLGTLMADLTRQNLRQKHDPPQEKSWINTDTDSSDEAQFPTQKSYDTTPQIVDDDFRAMYEDIFSQETEQLWRTSNYNLLQPHTHAGQTFI